MLKFLDEIDNPIFKTWRKQQKNVTMTINNYILAFRKYIISNKFVTESTRNELNKLLDDVAIRVHLSYKYSKLWFVNYIKRKPAVNELDLELNTIKIDDKKLIVYVDLDGRRKYLFTQKDFRNIVKNNLEHSYAYDHVPEPIPIKNPYTNKQISKTELMAINNMLIDSPLIWNMYRDCKYSIERFKIINYTYLMGRCIGSFLDQLDDTDIMFYIKDIFYYYGISNYCETCIRNKIGFREKLLRNILMQWLLTQKMLTIFTSGNLSQLCDMYSMPCKRRSTTIGKKCKYDSNKIDIEFTGGPLESNYVFTSNGLDEILNTCRVKTKKILKKKVYKTIK